MGTLPPKTLQIVAGDAKSQALIEELATQAEKLSAPPPPPIERLTIERMPSGGWIISEAANDYTKPRIAAARSTKAELLAFLDDNLEDVPDEPSEAS